MLLPSPPRMASTSTNPKPSAATNGGASAAHPYYPDPNPNAFYYRQNPSRNPNPNPNFFSRRRLFAVFIFLFIAMGSAVLIAYLVLHPKLPVFTLSSLRVTSFNLTADSIDGAFDLSLSVQNPNSRMAIAYSSLAADVALAGGGDPLASASLAPFSQPKRNATSLSAKMSAAHRFVGAGAAGSVRAGRANGAVRFDVRAVAVVSFRSMTWRMRRHRLSVLRGGAAVAFANGSANAGSMTNAPRRCRVGI